MKIKKILKIIGIILLVLLAILLVHAIKNFIIIRNLQSNISRYVNSNNYHICIAANEQNGTIMTTNYYKKYNREANLIERNMNGEIAKISIYSNDGKRNFYVENSKEKIAKLNTDALGLTVQIYNSLESDSIWHTFLSSIFTYIKTTKMNDKDCYIVGNYRSFIGLMPVGKNEYYIEKDTGLMIKSITNDLVSERKYEFDNVDDNVFVEPDINEYKLQSN